MFSSFKWKSIPAARKISNLLKSINCFIFKPSYLLLSPTIHKFGDEFIHSGLSAE